VHAITVATGVLASGTSDNSAHGFNWTFAFPMILFIVVATVLYLMFTRPHRVPGHGELRFTPEAVTKDGSVPDSETARAAAVASGFSTAAGGGAAETVVEAAGAHRAAATDDESGTVSQGPGAAEGPDADQPPTAQKPASDDPEASE